MAKPNWTAIKVKLGDIICWEHNPRMSNKAQAQRLIESERRWGQPMAFAVSPLKDGKVYLYDGHQRYSSWLTVYGEDYEVDARQSDIFLTEEERLEFVVTMHAGATGSWDWQKLSSFPAPKLIEMGFDNELKKQYDFDANNIKELLNSELEEPVDAEPQIDRAAELQEKWQTSTGQLWKLGDHRLLIGDCTVRENVERLMGGERAALCLTDPPYGVDVVGDAGNIGGDTQYAKAGKYSPVIGDDKPFSPAHLFDLADMQIIWGANYFCLDLPAVGQWLVWDKNRPDGTTFSDCELAWTNGKGIAIKKYKCTWDGFHREGESGQRYHPTQKPVKLTQDVLADFDGQIVIDPYGGSGTTMVACNNLGRKCRMIEIDPKYSAVILQRMSDLGVIPVLAE